MRRNGLDSTKNKESTLISRNDIILICVLFVCALIAFFWFHSRQTTGAEIMVTIDGEDYGIYALNQDQEIEIQGDDFISRLVIKDGKASMVEADCPDQICVHHTPIYQDGEMIICLPHRVIVLVEEEGNASSQQLDGVSK